MGIKIPAYRLQSKFHLPSFRHRLQGPYGKRRRSAELNLTAMIDLFSTLILYLLSTFSATGEILVVQKNLKIPEARHAKLLERSPILTVTMEGVALEGAGVGSNAGIKERIEEKDWEMPQLIAKLRQYKDAFQARDPGIPFPGNIIIQADRDLDFLYLKRVLYSVVGEGYTGINLVVRGDVTISPPKGR